MFQIYMAHTQVSVSLTGKTIINQEDQRNGSSAANRGSSKSFCLISWARREDEWPNWSRLVIVAWLKQAIFY